VNLLELMEGAVSQTPEQLQELLCELDSLQKIVRGLLRIKRDHRLEQQMAEIENERIRTRLYGSSPGPAVDFLSLRNRITALLPGLPGSFTSQYLYGLLEKEGFPGLRKGHTQTIGVVLRKLANSGMLIRTVEKVNRKLTATYWKSANGVPSTAAAGSSSGKEQAPAFAGKTESSKVEKER
jgi:hypothetical protein